MVPWEVIVVSGKVVKLPVQAVMLNRLIWVEADDQLTEPYRFFLAHAGRLIDGEGLAKLVMAASEKAPPELRLYMRVRSTCFIHALCYDREIADTARDAIFKAKTTPRSQPREQRL